MGPLLLVDAKVLSIEAIALVPPGFGEVRISKCNLHVAICALLTIHKRKPAPNTSVCFFFVCKIGLVSETTVSLKIDQSQAFLS